MLTRDLEITNPTGLHTRPGTKFVREAKKYQCEVTLRRGDKRANGKSLLHVMKIGVSQGDVVTFECDGVDEAEAMEALIALVESFDE